MRRIPKQAVVFFMVMALALVPFAGVGLAEDGSENKGPDGISMVADAIFARPIGFVATVAGTVLFILTLPFSAIGGNTGKAAEKLVVAPGKFTFARPLGHFPKDHKDTNE